MRKKNQKLVIAATAIGLASAACGADVEFDAASSGLPAPASPAVAAAADDLVLPEVVQPAGGYVVAEFEGFADPRTGQFEIVMLDEQLVLPSAEASGMRTVEQALFCNARVDANGVAGTGAENTVEVVTELVDYGAGPALFGTFDQCRTLPVPDCTVFADGSAEQLACIDQVRASPEANYSEGSTGAFCADVTIRSFFTTAVLDEVHTELYIVSPTAGHSGYVFPTGTGAPAYGGLSDEFGLWYYGDIGTADGVFRGCTGSRPADPNNKSDPGELNPAGTGPCDEKTRRWVFQNADQSYFYFRGRVRSEFREICNTVDDDCDGRFDEGANCYPDGDPCFDGSDCQAGVCIGGECGIPVVPDFVLSDVVTIGGGGMTANGLNRLELRIGAPAPMGAAQGALNRVILGPLADR